MKYVLLIVSCIVAFSAYNVAVIGPRLRNPYSFSIVFGKPGSGKSTTLQKVMEKHIKKGWRVFYDGASYLEAVEKVDFQAFKKGQWLPDGRKGMPIWQDSTSKIEAYTQYGEPIYEKHGPINAEDTPILVCFDELGITYNNREFKTNFTPASLEWWKKHRHKKVKIFGASQTYKDMDLKLRQLVDYNYLMDVMVLFPGLRVAKGINIKFDILNSESGDNAGGQIIEGYTYKLPIFHIYIWMPKWIKKFNSYA